MRNTFGFILLLAVFTALSPPAEAADEATCEARLAPIEKRLETGDYPEYAVQAARQLIDSIRKNCGNLNEELLDVTMKGFEPLLPVATPGVSPEQEAAEKAEREAAERAARDAARAQRKAKEARADSLPLSSLFDKPANAKVTASGFVDRVDDMGSLQIHDWDTLDGKLRVLSVSGPTLAQQSRDDALKHVYVTEIDRAGGTRQQRVTILGLDEAYKFGLYPGRDEIVIQRTTNAASSSIERWSIAGRERIAKTAAPRPTWSGQRLGEGDEFRYVTADGNLFFAHMQAAARNEESAILWQLISMDGKTLGSGKSGKPGELHSLSGWYRGLNGRVGLVMTALARDEPGLESMLETPVRFTHEGLTLRGVVGFEMRTLLVDADSNGFWSSPAIERQMVWMNLAEIAEGMSIADRDRIGHAQNAAAIEYGETLKVPAHQAAGYNREAIAPTRNGIALLLNDTANRLENPLRHGDWLRELSTDGATRETHLEAISKHLGGRFLLLSSPADDTMTLLVQGNQSHHVVKLDDKRQPLAYGPVEMPRDAPPMLLLADTAGCWIVSRGRGGTDMQRLWRARVD